MASSKKKANDSYYPLRWKVADFVENIIILHRTRAALGLAVLGLLLVLAGVFILGWRPGGDESAGSEQPAQTEIDPDTDDLNTDDTGVDTDADTGAANDDTPRPEATPEQLLATSSGTVVEITAETARLVGGFPTEAAADDSLDLVTEFFGFGAFDILDDSVVDDAFIETESLTIRIVDPLLFAEGTAEMNPNLFGIFDVVSDFLFINGDRQVEVRAHVDGQELSDERAEAVADRLVIALVEPDVISASGFGSDELADGENSRVDLIID